MTLVVVLLVLGLAALLFCGPYLVTLFLGLGVMARSADAEASRDGALPSKSAPSQP